MQELALDNDNNGKWLLRVSLAVFFICIAGYVITDSLYFLVGPFAFIFFLLLGINWKIAYWIMLFTIPFSEQFEFWESNTAISVPDEPLMWIFLALTVVVLIRQRKILPQWWWRNPIVFIVALHLLWLVVAVIFSKELFFSIKFFIAKLWYLACFFVIPVWIFKDKKDFVRGFLIMLPPLVATMVIIMVRHHRLNFSFKHIQWAIGDLYYNHVDYSTLTSMFFPLLWVAYPLTKKYNPFIRVGLLLLIAFFIPAIYLTYARAAMIAVFFSIAVGIAIRYRLVNFIMPTIYGVIALGLVYLAHNNRYIDLRPNFKETYMHTNFSDHILATFRGTDMSSMERLYRWIAAIRMSADRPLTGYGPHAFYYYYKPYAVSSFRTYVSNNWEQSTTHNYFLFMLVEQGWPAMLLYALLLIVVFAQAQRTYHRFKDRFYKYCTLGLAMLFAASFINNFFSELIETHKVGAVFYLCIALLVILDRKSKELAGEVVPEED